MSKFKEFLNKAVADEAAKKEILTILGEKKLSEATDEQFTKISGLATKLGIDITAAEMKEFARGSMELDDEELESVAGGWDDEGRPTYVRDWYHLALQLSEHKYDDDFGEYMEKLAKEHHIERIELSENWRCFLELGVV